MSHSNSNSTRHPRATLFIRSLFGLLALIAFILFFTGQKPWEVLQAISERSANGKSPLLQHDIDLGISIALLLNFLFCLFFIFTARFWCEPLPPITAATTTPQPKKSGDTLRFALWMGLLIFLALCLRLPLAQKSLWWDELWSLEKVVMGEVEITDEGQVALDAPSWKKTAFYYPKPTNHIPYSLSSRASLEIWQNLSGAAPGKFSELAYRAPSLLAGLLTIVLVGYLGRRWQLGLAAWIAPLLLALHPWFLRYSVEGRGFAFLLLFCTAALFALTGALRRLGWHCWIGFGAMLCAILWTFPHAVGLCLFLVLIAAWLVWKKPTLPERRVGLKRLTVAVVGSAMLFIQLAAPLVPQILRWKNITTQGGILDGQKLSELYLFLLNGMLLRSPEVDAMTWPNWIDWPTWLSLFHLLWASVLIAWGLVALWKKYTPAGILLFSTIGAALFALALVVASGHRFYFENRYVIYLLLPIAFALAVGMEAIRQQIGALSSSFGKILGNGFLLTTLLAYGALTWPQTRLLLHYPVAPMRDVAYFFSANIESREEPWRACYGLGNQRIRLYDPWMKPVETLAEVEALCRRAEKENRPLYVCYGYPGFHRVILPEAFALLDDPRFFRPVKHFSGIEPELHFRIFEYTGRPLP